MQGQNRRNWRGEGGKRRNWRGEGGERSKEGGKRRKEGVRKGEIEGRERESEGVQTTAHVGIIDKATGALFSFLWQWIIFSLSPTPPTNPHPHPHTTLTHPLQLLPWQTGTPIPPLPLLPISSLTTGPPHTSPLTHHSTPPHACPLTHHNTPPHTCPHLPNPRTPPQATITCLLEHQEDLSLIIGWVTVQMYSGCLSTVCLSFCPSVSYLLSLHPPVCLSCFLSANGG